MCSSYFRDALAILFPSYCIGCQASLGPERKRLCLPCYQELLESWQQPRCRTCQCPVHHTKVDQCLLCRNRSFFWQRLLSVFPSPKMAERVLKQLASYPESLPAWGALAALRILKSPSPLPSAISTPSNNRWWRFLRGPSPEEGLAKTLASLLQRPYLPLSKECASPSGLALFCLTPPSEAELSASPLSPSFSGLLWISLAPPPPFQEGERAGGEVSF